jgi:hypothetical protein
MYILYNILAIIVFICLVLPYYLYRLVFEKGFKTRFRESMGIVRMLKLPELLVRTVFGFTALLLAKS